MKEIICLPFNSKRYSMFVYPKKVTNLNKQALCSFYIIKYKAVNMSKFMKRDDFYSYKETS